MSHDQDMGENAFRSTDVNNKSATMRITKPGYRIEADISGGLQEVSRDYYDNTSSMDAAAELKAQQKQEQQQGRFNPGYEQNQGFLSMRLHLENARMSLLRARTFAEKHRRFYQISEEYRAEHVDDVLGKKPGQSVTKECYDELMRIEKEIQFFEQHILAPYEEIINDAKTE